MPRDGEPDPPLMAADRVTVLFGLDGASMHKPEWATLRGSALRVTFGA